MKLNLNSKDVLPVVFSVAATVLCAAIDLFLKNDGSITALTTKTGTLEGDDDYVS